MAFILYNMGNPRKKIRPAYVTKSPKANDYKKRVTDIKAENKIENDRNSVMEFQKRYNNYLKENNINATPLKIDGVVGPKTYAAMIKSKETPIAPVAPKMVQPEQIVTPPALPPVPNKVDEQNKQSIQALNEPVTPSIPPNVVPLDESKVVFPEAPLPPNNPSLPAPVYYNTEQSTPVYGDHNSILNKQNYTSGISYTNGNQPGFFPGLGLFAKNKGNGNQSNTNQSSQNGNSEDSNRRRLFEYDRNNNEASVNLEAIPNFVMRNRQGEIIRPFGKLRDKIAERKSNKETERSNIENAIAARLKGEQTDYMPSSKKEANTYRRKFDKALNNQIEAEKQVIELEGHNDLNQNYINQRLQNYNNLKDIRTHRANNEQDYLYNKADNKFRIDNALEAARESYGNNREDVLYKKRKENRTNRTDNRIDRINNMYSIPTPSDSKGVLLNAFEPTQWDNNPEHLSPIQNSLNKATNLNDMSNQSQAEWMMKNYKDNLNNMSNPEQAQFIMNNYKEESPDEIKQDGGLILNESDILPKAEGGSYSNDFAYNPPQTVELNNQFPDGRIHKSYSDYLTNIQSGQGTKSQTPTETINTANPVPDSSNKNSGEFQYNPTRLMYYGNRMQANANMLPVLYNTSKALFDKPEIQRPIYNKQDQSVLAGMNNNKINANYNNINTGRVVAMDAIRNNARGSGSLMNNLIASNANANRQMNDEAYRVNQSNQSQENMYLNKLHEVGTNRQLENKYIDEANRKHRLAMEEFRRDALESGEKAMINKGQLLNSELNNQMQIEGYLNQIGADYKFHQDNFGNLKVEMRDKNGNSKIIPVGTDSKGLMDMYRTMGATYGNSNKTQTPAQPTDNGQTYDVTSAQRVKKNGGKVYKRKFLF